MSKTCQVCGTPLQPGKAKLCSEACVLQRRRDQNRERSRIRRKKDGGGRHEMFLRFCDGIPFYGGSKAGADTFLTGLREIAKTEKKDGRVKYWEHQ